VMASVASCLAAPGLGHANFNQALTAPNLVASPFIWCAFLPFDPHEDDNGTSLCRNLDHF
jgi:hypothetical protein